jgi:predicted PhzF superfamily epimerase YddE/YHI9
MACPGVLVEAFTESPCGGNGAAVVLLDRPLAAGPMQALARSLNQSETAFLLRHPDGWLLRWFTPSCEVNLCGHATLAATLALGHWGLLEPGAAVSLHSRGGPLAVALQGAAGPASIVLPSGGLRAAEPSPALVVYLHQHLAQGAQAYWESPLGYCVVLLPSAAPLAGTSLPAEGLPAEVRGGLVLMQPLGGGRGDGPASPPSFPQVLGKACDYQIRFLAPGLGIPEDPVTGSAHALVAPWWLDRLGVERVRGWQCSDRPGGMVCEAASSGMIRLSGAGHLLWHGSLQLGCGGSCDVDPCGWNSLLA